MVITSTKQALSLVKDGLIFEGRQITFTSGIYEIKVIYPSEFKRKGEILGQYYEVYKNEYGDTELINLSSFTAFDLVGGEI